MIYTFGDSHARIPWEQISNININSLGPRLMYTFGRQRTKLIDLSNHKISDNDTLIFCFGEIDCRCHIYKYDRWFSNYKRMINKVSKSYIGAVKSVVAHLADVKVNVCVYNVVPPMKKKYVTDKYEYPFLGSDALRRRYTLYMNECLEILCKENHLIYFDIYEEYSTQDGYLELSLSDGICHINDPKYIVKQIESLGLS